MILIACPCAHYLKAVPITLCPTNLCSKAVPDYWRLHKMIWQVPKEAFKAEVLRNHYSHVHLQGVPAFSSQVSYSIPPAKSCPRNQSSCKPVASCIGHFRIRFGALKLSWSRSDTGSIRTKVPCSFRFSVILGIGWNLKSLTHEYFKVTKFYILLTVIENCQ